MHSFLDKNRRRVRRESIEIEFWRNWRLAFVLWLQDHVDFNYVNDP